MAGSAAALLRQYAKLTEFLGRALGPDYEVALHDLTDTKRSLVAIANGHISGRKVGAPLTNRALSILRDKSYEQSDYCLHDYGLSANGKELRSNTLFIKQDGKLIGMLCINFDDSRYRAVSSQLLGLCHPDAFFTPVDPAEELPGRASPERFADSTDAVVKEAVARELKRLGVTADRLTAEERTEIIGALEAGGVFLIKGAVKETAEELRCSQASVYRYLAKMKNESNEAQ